MPSELHEALLLLFRNRPMLAPELVRDALHFELPPFTEARIDSADLTDVKPSEYGADLVVLLLDGVPVYGIVVEAQLSRKPRKKFVWPVYAASLRARLELPVALLVVTADDAIKAARIALAAHGATLFLDAERGRMYFDLVLASLSEAAQQELRLMDPAKYVYRSDYAKQWIGVGRAEGEVHGRAALLERQLTRRFGALPAEAAERLTTATIDELDAIGERLLTAPSLEEALGPR
jgi:hypothetical protein